MFAAVSCEGEKPEPGPDPNGGSTQTPEFTILDESIEDIPLEGGQIIVRYKFENRPEGEFSTSLPEGHWVSNFYVVSDTSFSFNIQKNMVRPRSVKFAIQYTESDGSLTVSQGGNDADVIIEAKILTGEYYSEPGLSTNPNYYTWVSDLGLWVKDSEGINFDIYGPIPEKEQITVNGSVRDVIKTLPEGTYYYAAGSYEYYTFSEYSFYGVYTGNHTTGQFGYEPRVAITGGEFTITHLDSEGREISLDASVTGEDGKVYMLTFTGPLTEFIYY